jgi:hypothetical protein
VFFTTNYFFYDQLDPDRIDHRDKFIINYVF